LILVLISRQLALIKNRNRQSIEGLLLWCPVFVVRHEAQFNLTGESPVSKVPTRHIEYRVLGG